MTNPPKIEIITNDSDNAQSRVILKINGIEIDILADDDGVVATIQNPETLEEYSAASVEWSDVK